MVSVSGNADYEWISKHYSDLQGKYPNMYIVVKDGKVLSADHEYGKARDLAIKSARDFVVAYILSGEPFVLPPILRHRSHEV